MAAFSFWKRQTSQVENCEPASVVRPDALHFETGTDDPGSKLLDVILVGPLCPHALSCREVDDTVINADLLRPGADQVHFHAVEPGIVGGPMVKCSEVKI